MNPSPDLARRLEELRSGRSGDSLAWRDLLLAQIEAGMRPTLTVWEMLLAAHAEYHHGEREEWLSGVFHMARLLRACPHLTHLGASAALSEVERVLADWIGGQGRVTGRAAEGWAKWFGLDREDVVNEWERSWERIRSVPGLPPLEYARIRGDHRPIHFKPRSLSIRSKKYERFLSMAAWLQVGTGAGVMLLPRDQVADLLKAPSKLEVGMWVKAGIRDRLLMLVREHNAEAARAASYVFDVRRVPTLEEVTDAELLSWLENEWE
jgi:hypothetical protein